MTWDLFSFSAVFYTSLSCYASFLLYVQSIFRADGLCGSPHTRGNHLGELVPTLIGFSLSLVGVVETFTERFYTISHTVTIVGLPYFCTLSSCCVFVWISTSWLPCCRFDAHKLRQLQVFSRMHPSSIQQL